NVTSVINGHKIPVEDDGEIDYYTAQIEGAYDYSPFGVTRLSYEPNYAAGGGGGEPHPLAPDYRWCFDGNGVEANGSGHNATYNNVTHADDRNGNPNSAFETAGAANSYVEIADHADFDFGSDDFT